MLNNVISTDAIVDMVKKQSSTNFKAIDSLLYAYTEAQLKSVVEQILQICNNNIKR